MKRGIACFLLILLAGLGRAASPAPELLLGSDTLAVCTLLDAQGARTFYKESPYGKLAGDPAMRPFVSKLMDKVRAEAIVPLEREFGVTFSEYAELAQGQVTLALTRSGWEGKPGQRPGFLLVLDAKEKSAELEARLTALKSKWVDSGKKLRTERIRNIEFATLIFKLSDLERTLDQALGDEAKSGDAPAEAGEGEELNWLVGQSDSLLIVGDHATDIEKVLIRQSGGSVPSLMENPVFASNHASMLRGSMGYFWLDLGAVISVVRANLPSGSSGGGLGAFNPASLFEPLGLEGLESLVWSSRSTPDGCLFEVLLGVPASKRKGLFELLAFERLDAAPPPFVPGSAVKFSRFRLDLSKTWNGLETLLGQINPQLAGVLKLLVDTVGKDQDPDFDLRKNVIANLGNDLISIEKAPADHSLESLASPPTLVLVGSPSPGQLASGLRALSGLMPATGAQPKERDFLGRTIYSIPLPAEDDTAPPRSLSYAASGGYVALSTDVAMLEAFLRSGGDPGDSLRARPGLAQAAEEVGGMGTGLFGFEDQRQTMRAVMAVLKDESGTLADLLSGAGIGEELKQWVDFSLLPDFERVAQYFHISVWAGRVTPQGFRFQVFGPNPPGF